MFKAIYAITAGEVRCPRPATRSPSKPIVAPVRQERIAEYPDRPALQNCAESYVSAGVARRSRHATHFVNRDITEPPRTSVIRNGSRTGRDKQAQARNREASPHGRGQKISESTTDRIFDRGFPHEHFVRKPALAISSAGNRCQRHCRDPVMRTRSRQICGRAG